LQSVLDWEAIGISQDDATVRQRNIEREFDLWANSYHSDFDGINYFGDNQALGYFNLLLNGDFFFMPVWRAPIDPRFPYELTIKLIDADLVRDPIDSRSVVSDDIQGGIEKNKEGRVIAVHVWNTYSNDLRYNTQAKSTRVPVYRPDGTQQIYQVYEPERIGQRRGIPLLASSSDSLKQLTRLADAELMSALVSSFFTVFVKDSSGFNAMMGPALTPEEAVTGGGRYSPTEAEATTQYEEDGNDLEMGYGNITYLDDSKDVTVADPKKVDKDFAKFWEGVATQVSASANMPIEQALQKYETSYTAARAALNDVWKYRQAARTLMNRKFNQVIFEEFFRESVTKGRIDAPGYGTDYGISKAWTRSMWVGVGQGSLDPFREARASALRLSNKTTTREIEYMEQQGGRWDTAVRNLAREEALIEELGLNEDIDTSVNEAVNDEADS
jgi:lambda family phage portal protein